MRSTSGLRAIPFDARTAALLGLAVGLPLGEAAGLRLAGLTSFEPAAAQATAPPPFGVFHDLRWLLVFHDSWWSFGLETAAAVAFRTLVSTGLAALAWPRGAPRPPLGAQLRSAAFYVVGAMVLLLPAATLDFGAAGTSLSWFFFSGMLLLALLALVLNRGGIAPGWWRYPPTPVTIGIAVLTFVALTAASTATAAAPGWWSLLGVLAGGLMNAALWTWLVRTVALTDQPTIPAFVTPLVAIAIPVVYLAFGTQLIGRAQAGPSPSPRSADRLTQPGGHQVMYVNGYDSTYLAPIPGYPPDIRITAFSYRGQYPDGAPLPYGPDATHQSLGTLARRLAGQLDDLHRRTGRPVEIVAESEGTFIVRTYLEQYPHPGVARVILLSPLIRPARVYYPPQAQDHGWGLATGWMLRGLTYLSRIKTGSTVSADEPFIRSVMDNGPRYRSTMLCPIDGVPMLAVIPTASAAVVPPGHVFTIPSLVVEGLHGSLTDQGEVHRDMVAVLRGAAPAHGVPPAYQLLRDAAAGWQVPPLPQSYVAAWHAADRPDPVLDGSEPCRGR